MSTFKKPSEWSAATLKAIRNLISALIYPAADSTSAVKVTKADGVTEVAVFDTVNNRSIFKGKVGINVSAPAYKLVISSEVSPLVGSNLPQAVYYGGSFADGDFRSGQIVVGILSSFLGGAFSWSNLLGGVFIDNLWDNAIGFIAFRVRASGVPVECLRLLGNGNVRIMNGSLGVGVSSPSSKLDVNGAITSHELAVDPADPIEGSHVIWQSNGVGSGDDGDIMIKITAGGVTKLSTLVDFSSL